MTAPLRVVTVTVEELGELVEAAVRRALEATCVGAGTSRTRSNAGEWLDTAGAAALLEVNRRTIIKLARTGKLRGSRDFGKLWQFRRADVETLLEKRDARERPRRSA